MCVEAEEHYDNTLMLSYAVPLVVILLISLLTDLYTFYHINYCKQFSAHHEEYIYLRDKCRICETHCHDKSIIVQKVDIPLKSTATSCILFAFTCLSIYTFTCGFSYESDLKDYISNLTLVFFTTINIPMIVCLSTNNNYVNMASARQRNNTHGWNRTENQQWEIKCAREDRIQNV